MHGRPALSWGFDSSSRVSGYDTTGPQTLHAQGLEQNILAFKGGLSSGATFDADFADYYSVFGELFLAYQCELDHGIEGLVLQHGVNQHSIIQIVAADNLVASVGVGFD